MTIQQCIYVLETAKFGSISQAAKKLFVAQSSLSESVKALEEELGIEIFRRSTSGVSLTEDGAEFLKYAGQICAQSDFILNRYTARIQSERLYISTQHYDFVADVFAKIIRAQKSDAYTMALRERPTYEVIRDVENSVSDIGILAIKSSDESVMIRYLQDRNLEFVRVMHTPPHVYIGRDHPLADRAQLSAAELSEYPYVSYDQGTNTVSFFEEEIFEGYSKKHIEISDRATLMNVLLSTDSYTIGTGIMPSELNDGKIISVPYENDAYYIIGYILPKNRMIGEPLRQFIEHLGALREKQGS